MIHVIFSALCHEILATLTKEQTGIVFFFLDAPSHLAEYNFGKTGRSNALLEFQDKFRIWLQ